MPEIKLNLRSFSILGALFVSLFTETLAYVPATATNTTGPNTDFQAADNSTILVTWAPNGSYMTVVSYQSAGQASQGISKGALVRFSEDNLANQDGTSAPWIALINCDTNSTNMSLETDIFTLAHERGAVASLLYSNRSDGCNLNSEYRQTNPHLMDIFTPKRPSVALLIQSVFNNINGSYTTFNPALLNASQDSITAALPRNALNESPYLIATLRAANASGEENPDDPAPVPTQVDNTGSALPHVSRSVLGSCLGVFAIGVALLF